MSDIQISVIKCANCGSTLNVEVNDEITYCISCGSGFELVDGKLYPIEVNFISPIKPQEGELIYKPFWKLETNVNIIERDAGGGVKKVFSGVTSKGGGILNFVIPAFDCSIEALKKLSMYYTFQNPTLFPQKFSVSLKGFSYSRDDARKLAEFTLISFEAEKSDTVRSLKYEIKFLNDSILGIPFYLLQNKTLIDAVSGMSIK
ncbi:MAG: hypothetical protein ACP5P3_00330 [Ignavibacteria bacterium]